MGPMNESLEHLIACPAERKHATPLLLLHGAWHGAFCWTRFLDYLPSLGYEVHAISLPGHGKSPLAKGHINRYSIQDYVDCLAQEIDKVSPRPVVVGHSMGGFVTQKYLESEPLPGAVLLASVPHTGALRFLLRLYRRHFWVTTRTFAARKAEIASPEMAGELFLSPDSGIDLEGFYNNLVRESIRAACQMSFWLRTKPDKISCPTLVIAAENDEVFSVEEEERLAAALNAKFELLPGTAHDIMLESAWKDAADMIDRWITQELTLP